jgi:hypothetical protein
MEKFTLQNIPAASLGRTMRDLFQDLIDITAEDAGTGCLKSVPTNFGYAFFWYGWLNKKMLEKYYQAYVSTEKVREVKKRKKKESMLTFQDQIGDFLFSIVREHPEVIGKGHVEVHLAMLTPKLKQLSVLDAAKSLKTFSEKLEKLETFRHKFLGRKKGSVVDEIETSFETIDFITQEEVAKYTDEYFWDDECGYVEIAHRRLACEIQVNVNFDGNDSLGEVITRIDRVISPLKRDVEIMFRFGQSLWPF